MASIAPAALRLISHPLLSSFPQKLSFLSHSPSPSHLHPIILSSPPSRLFCTSSPIVSAAPSIRLQDQLLHPSPSEQEEEEFERDDEEEEEPPIKSSLPSLPSPKLSVKEKKELASYAHGLGKKLKSQQVGKSGVTPAVAASFVENLESNELLKLKIHGSCPGELNDVIQQLEEATGSVAVGQIGRSVILYRPSLSKAKKKESPVFKRQEKGQAPRVPGQGHHWRRPT